MSGGTLNHKARESWENDLFGGVYNKSTGRDRVKYGVLNIVKDVRGIKVC
jgi:hypothetical protein